MSRWSLLLMMIVASQTLAAPTIVPDGFNSEGLVEHRGRYYNPNYCFSVVIPEGVVGKSDPPPAPHHRFGAQLDEEGHSYLYVGADYGAEIDPLLTAKRVMHRRYPANRAPVPVRLGALRGLRGIHRYECGNGRCVNDVVVAVSGGRVFELQLISTADRYDEAARILERVRESWRLERCR